MPWGVIRMQVESVARCSMLDLTWAQVKDVLENLPLHRKLEAGKGLDHSDRIRLQKLADGETPSKEPQPDPEPRQTFK